MYKDKNRKTLDDFELKFEYPDMGIKVFFFKKNGLE
jgi:hypothetical protein